MPITSPDLIFQPVELEIEKVQMLANYNKALLKALAREILEQSGFTMIQRGSYPNTEGDNNIVQTIFSFSKDLKTEEFVLTVSADPEINRLIHVKVNQVGHGHNTEIFSKDTVIPEPAPANSLGSAVLIPRHIYRKILGFFKS